MTGLAVRRALQGLDRERLCARLIEVARAEATPPRVRYRLETRLEDLEQRLDSGGSDDADKAFRGDYMATRKRGAWVSFEFTGSAVALSATKWNGAGSAHLWIDGKYKGTVDFSASKDDFRRIVASYYWEASGAHSITLEVESGWISVDTFLVLR